MDQAWKQRFEDFTPEVPEGQWAAIRNHMPAGQQPSRRRRSLRIAAGTALVMLTILLGWWWWPDVSMPAQKTAHIDIQPYPPQISGVRPEWTYPVPENAAAAEPDEHPTPHPVASPGKLQWMPTRVADPARAEERSNAVRFHGPDTLPQEPVWPLLQPVGLTPLKSKALLPDTARETRWREIRENSIRLEPAWWMPRPPKEQQRQGRPLIAFEFPAINLNLRVPLHKVQLGGPDEVSIRIPLNRED